jgi:pimeloyl-ACP methyl ester carboxylesterase
MVVDRRRVLSGSLVVGGLLVSGCHTDPAGPGDGEPAVPWPDGDILGIGLEGYPYPHSVHYLDVTHVAQADWIDRQAPDWERRGRLAYMDVPPDSAQSKAAILLVHGKNFFGAYWTGVIEALRHAGFRVIVPDLIGWGNSTKPSTLTTAPLVTHQRSLVDQLKVDSFVFIGHSTGGLVGMHMARALPERVHTRWCWRTRWDSKTIETG